MEKSEPTLVPEWLRSTGNASGGGGSANHFASSSAHSDVSSSAPHSRNRSSKSASDRDSFRLTLDRTSRSFSNGSSKHPYSSFSRSHRDKDRDRDRDKERLAYGDYWDHDSSDPIGSILTGKGVKDKLRRSQSMVSRKQSEASPHRVVSDFKNGSSNNHANGLVSGGNIGNSSDKIVFEKDFPSLGNEDIARVSSPGLSTAVQSLPFNSSPLMSGEGWTSALAEVPAVIGSGTPGPGTSSCGTFSSSATGPGSGTMSLSAAQAVASMACGTSSAMAGLNMAEALTQASPRTRTAPQLSVQTLRREELAIKQSKQLIPVTPSMPKSSVLNSSDKSKPRIAIRSGEINTVSKTVQQQPPPVLASKQSQLGGPVKADTPKTSHGKLFILKPGWENGASPSPKNVSNPTNNANRAANSKHATPPTPSVPLKSSNNPKLLLGEQKSANLNLISGLNVEKKPSLSQSQSRLAFFNHLKKKTSGNSASVPPDPSAALSSPTGENSCEANKEIASAPASPRATDNGVELTVNGGSFEKPEGFSEAEVTFLRSLGWEEGVGDEGQGLTEEEINAFYKVYNKQRPSLKIGMQQKPSELHAADINESSSPSSSSNSDRES